MVRGLQLSVIGAALALGALLVYGVFFSGSKGGLDIGDPAPVAALPRLGDEGSGSLADYRGKVVVVNLWASWCPPCKDELPLLEKTHKAIAARGGLVLGVNTRDLVDRGLETAREYRLTFPSIRDGSGDYAQRFGPTGYPETFVVDGTGKVVALRRGPVDQAWIDANVMPLLEAA
jgi:cytochrome c biogenesis protein CcmG, thiol:disulfide interchange protein DsbE